MFLRIGAVALATAILLALPALPTSAQTVVADASALTQATHRRVVEFWIDAPPDKAMESLLTRVDIYDPTIAEVRFDHSQSATPGRMGVGSRRICIFTDGRMLVEPILIYDPPNAYAYTADRDASTMSLPVREIVLSYEFREDAGGTLVSVDVFYDPSVPGTGPVIEPVLTGTLRRTFRTATNVFGGAYLGDRKP